MNVPRHMLQMVQVLATLCLSLFYLLSVDSAMAEVEVKVGNFSFDPRDITIPVGEQVKWAWEGGTHTTTNGTGSSDPEAGSLWDENISFSSQTFTFQFNEPGFFPYFCRPHEDLDMKGTITVEAPTGIGDDAGTGGGTLPRAMVLSQNYPNPFNPSTTFDVMIPVGDAQPSALRIHDLRGAVVKTIYQGMLAAGEYHFSWDGKSDPGERLPSGIYLYRLEYGDQVVTRKMTLLK